MIYKALALACVLGTCAGAPTDKQGSALVPSGGSKDDDYARRMLGVAGCAPDDFECAFKAVNKHPDDTEGKGTGGSNTTSLPARGNTTEGKGTCGSERIISLPAPPSGNMSTELLAPQNNQDYRLLGNGYCSDERDKRTGETFNQCLARCKADSGCAGFAGSWSRARR